MLDVFLKQLQLEISYKILKHIEVAHSLGRSNSLVNHTNDLLQVKYIMHIGYKVNSA